MNAISPSPVGATRLLWFGNTLVDIVIPSATGGDGICVIEHRAPHGDSPPLHIHHNEDELFHLISGRLRLRVEGRDQIATPGMTLLAPKGIPHTYRVESAEGARWLTVTHGRDFESMVRAASRPARAAELPEAAAPTPEAIDRLVRLCAENGIDIVGAPLG
jgi:quercetin dioxygenase-like cupin family protein